jgi:Ca2+-transporting ATPase
MRKSLLFSIQRTKECMLPHQGAVENILDRSNRLQLSDGSVAPLSPQAREAILQKLSNMTTRALRCLAFAYTDDLGPLERYDGTEAHPAHKVLLSLDGYANIESNLVFVGMAGLQVRPLCTCSNGEGGSA